MRKDELILTHGLLSKIKEYLEGERNIKIDTEEYDQLRIKPTNIGKPKADQKQAIFTLASSIVNAVEDIEPTRNYLSFTEEDVHKGKLAPVPEAEPYVMETIENIAETHPNRVRPYIPFTICFIANGDSDSRRAAIRTIDTYINQTDTDMSDLAPDLRDVSESIDDTELKSRFGEMIEDSIEKD